MDADQDRARRNSLLVTLRIDGPSVARTLRDDLENVHGIAVTQDRVLADLVWLADVGAVLLQDKLACLTQDGRDHVAQLRRLF